MAVGTSQQTLGKRLFKDSLLYPNSTNSPKFKRRCVNAIRRFPRLCGPPVAPQHEQKDNDDLDTEKSKKFHSLKFGLEAYLFGSCSKGAGEDSSCSKGSAFETFKIPTMDVTFINPVTNQVKEAMESDRKSVGEEDEEEDDDCAVIDEKSSTMLNGKVVIDDHHLPIILNESNSSHHLQGQMSQEWDFEWVEDNGDDVSFMSYSESRTFTNKKCENLGKVSKETMEAKDSQYDASMKVASPNDVHEVLNLYHNQHTKLLLEHGGGRYKNVLTVIAAMMLKKEHKWLNIESIFGHVPGVEIGDRFKYRAELVVIGLHHEFMHGISCTTIDGQLYASSIVDSAHYENKRKSSNVLIYSGEGGHSGIPGQLLEDQRLERGNLALKNSMDAKLPVRVIRKSFSEPSKGMYVYDGLYNARKSWDTRSKNGKRAFMFELVRTSDQRDFDQITINNPRKFDRDSHNKGTVIVDDLSQGKENIPIMVLNEINDEKPAPFIYITKIQHASLGKLSPPCGCNCSGGCSDSHLCPCVVKNKGEIPFNEEGALLRAKKIIYECGPSCKCPPSCQNRVSQHGLKLPLEVFRTKSTGWGVRSREAIRSGTFICEYLGDVLSDEEAEQTTNDDYLFDLGDGDGFTMDACKCGNVGRFINHSCSPNLYVQKVLYDHEDRKLPHLMLFATEDIPALEELTYYYNYKINHVRDANGSIKRMYCCCCSPNCSGRLY